MSNTPDPAQLVHDIFKAYATKDRALAESLIAEDFTFTSPLDDGIDRAVYFGTDSTER